MVSGRKRLRVLSAMVIAVGGLMSPAATAQDGQPVEPWRIPPRERPGQIIRQEIHPWTTDEVARVGEMLVGSWRTVDPVAQRTGAGSVHVLMHIAKVAVRGLDDVMYIELAREDDLARPYRQAFIQIYHYHDGLRLRTFEPRNFSDGLRPFAGFWAIPDQFPPIARENLVATMDIDLRPVSDGGYAGATPHPFPTDLFGAVEMSSAIRLREGEIATADRGYDAHGNVLWGVGPESAYRFRRHDMGMRVTDTPMGLTILEYPMTIVRVPQDGDMIRWAYRGWIWEDGRQFHSSDDDEILPEYQHPPAEGMLNFAWEEAVVGSGMGTVKRFIAPPERAYMHMGWPAKGVPPNTRLIFHLECVNVETPEPQEETATEDGDER